MTSLAALSICAECLVSTEPVLHVRQRVDQAADAGDRLTDLAAYVGEVVGQVAGTAGQQVEVTGAVADQAGRAAVACCRLRPPDKSPWPVPAILPWVA